MEELSQRILDAMKQAGKPVRPGELAATLQVDPKVLNKALKLLKDAGKITIPKKCFYGLPE